MKKPTEMIYEQILDALRRREAVAVATVVESRGSGPREPGAKILVFPDGETIGTIGGGASEAWVIRRALEALTDGRSRLLRRPARQEDRDACGEGMSFFVDVLLPRPTLLVVGAGHIGQAVASLGAWLDYRVFVLDERESMVSPERFPDAHLLLSGPVSERLRSLPLTDRVYVLIVTPHHSPDEQVLAVLWRYEAAYVGLLGGRRRTQATFERARALGVPDDFLRQIHTPIGLDIHAETPREIALSILADVTVVRRGGI